LQTKCIFINSVGFGCWENLIDSYKEEHLIDRKLRNSTITNEFRSEKTKIMEALNPNK